MDYLWYNIEEYTTIMSSKKYSKTGKKGRSEEWSWEENPETLKALEEYRKIARESQEKLND